MKNEQYVGSKYHVVLWWVLLLQEESNAFIKEYDKLQGKKREGELWITCVQGQSEDIGFDLNFFFWVCHLSLFLCLK